MVPRRLVSLPRQRMHQQPADQPGRMLHLVQRTASRSTFLLSVRSKLHLVGVTLTFFILFPPLYLVLQNDAMKQQKK